MYPKNCIVVELVILILVFFKLILITWVY